MVDLRVYNFSSLTQFIPYSKRFIPELVNFISNCTGLVCTLSKRKNDSVYLMAYDSYHPPLITAVFYPPFTVHCKLRLGNCKKWPSTSPPKLTRLFFEALYNSSPHSLTLRLVLFAGINFSDFTN